MAATVYFTREITPEKVVELYHKLGVDLPGKVAVKVHSGEKGNQNFIRPAFWKPMLDEVNGTFVENNTAYGDAAGGVRDHTEGHLALLEYHGWTKYLPVDLMDAEGPDIVWDIPNGKVLKTNTLGKNILNYDSMLVLAHFKGHPMGGFGGALKQLSIGCASAAGKALIHSGGNTTDNIGCWGKGHAEQDTFCEAMADAASTVVKHFGENIAYINVMKNLSVDCRTSASWHPPTRSPSTRPASTSSMPRRTTPDRRTSSSVSRPVTVSTPSKRPQSSVSAPESTNSSKFDPFAIDF